MTWTWNPWALGGFVAAAIAWPLAWVVLRADPGNRLNVHWALFLFSAGLVNLVAAGIGRLAPLEVAYSIAIARRVADMAIVWFLWLFVAAIPGTPAWMRHRATQTALLVIIVGLMTGWVAWTDRFVAIITHPLGYWTTTEKGGGLVGFAVFIAAATLSAIGALVARRRAAGPGRERTRWLTTTFLVFYAFVMLANLFGTVLFGAVPGAAEILFPAAYLVTGIVMAYGIVHAQIFDIDLRVYRGISRTTVAAVTAGAAFLGSELVEQAFDVDGTLPAVFIAGATALAFRPLAALGNRLAGRVLPHVEDTPAYREQRARDLYGAAFASALQDGQLSEKERDVLVTLAQKLGLSQAQVTSIERGVAE